MQLTKDQTDANLIGAWEPGRIRIGDQWYHGHLIVSAERILLNWAVNDPDRLTVDDFTAAFALQPQIVLLGTGSGRVLPDIELMAAFAERHVGLEIMTTAAVCRTFNVLVHERREVVAAILNG
jgi:uncharacterized protein